MQVLKFSVFLDVMHVTRPVVPDDLEEDDAFIFNNLIPMVPLNPETQHHIPKARFLNI